MSSRSVALFKSCCWLWTYFAHLSVFFLTLNMKFPSEHILEGLTIDAKLFVDCTLLFMLLKHLRIISKNVINNWAFQWKWNLIQSLPNKLRKSVIFSCKAKEIYIYIYIYYPPLVFNNSSVYHSSSQKHLVLYLTPSWHLMNI